MVAVAAAAIMAYVVADLAEPLRLGGGSAPGPRASPGQGEKREPGSVGPKPSEGVRIMKRLSVFLLAFLSLPLFQVYPS